jgi:hypothetical protein
VTRVRHEPTDRIRMISPQEAIVIILPIVVAVGSWNHW